MGGQEIPAWLADLAHPDATLGLLPGAVALVPSNPRWPRLFEQVADHLRMLCSDIDLDVAHIGSTAVPGLAAKPVLDIALGIVGTVPTAEIIRRLEGGGFAFEQDLGDYGGLFFTAHAETGVVAHVHVVDVENFQWRWYLRFRDGLRNDDSVRDEYARQKQRAAELHRGDRAAYTQAKVNWVLETLMRFADR